MVAPNTTPEERRLCHELLTAPAAFHNRYTPSADRHLRETLFRALARNRPDYLGLFFPAGPPPAHSAQPWSLREAQGAVDGAEYTAAAKGTACGHIFRSGESTYHCKTCAADDTCVLCVRCFESSEHEHHNVFISVSPGNSGCCDCGDPEAWRREVRCEIHSAHAHGGGARARQPSSTAKEKAAVGVSQLPPDLLEAIRMTIARAVDYLCDVFSCSPEQLRLPKSEESVRKDEELSRLGQPYGEDAVDLQPEFALVLWNDEKHTVDDVQNQVARACRKSRTFGRQVAHEVDDVGRCVVHCSKDVKELLQMAAILEQIKVTVTVRSTRDTFREQMCATIVDWISDIAGCAVGGDAHILRDTVCEELLKPWRTGSSAYNVDIGQAGLDDHEQEENTKTRERYMAFLQPFRTATGNTAGGGVMAVEVVGALDAGDDDDEADEDDEFDDMDVELDEEVEIEVEAIRQAANAARAMDRADPADMDIDYLDDADPDVMEAAFAGYPPPPPPPAPGQGRAPRDRIMTPADSDDGESTSESRPATNMPYHVLPKTPKGKNSVVSRSARRSAHPSKHWLEKPDAYISRGTEPCEDLWQRVRLDYLILYDLRLWKSLRVHLRHLYITTVVTIPNFKRILGLRFAGLYTALSQLYLIADREPDHSIINLSVQMLTTPSITSEVVERGNFFTNLMAILYTFLTTRQVGLPEDVNPRATLAFDAGAVTNRRIFHFFMDLKWLCQSEYIHHKLRTEQRYLLQFLDLLKLHQGVCPNVRATNEHVEYESDAWISASMIVKEINKLCKQVAVSYSPSQLLDDDEDGDERMACLQRALRVVAQLTMIHAFGYERKRFVAAELREEMAWHDIQPSSPLTNGQVCRVPKFEVQSQPMSFHHPLHYLLSWLLEEGKSMTRSELRALLAFAPEDLRDPWNSPPRGGPSPPRNLTSDELLCGIFEHPLRTYVWLSQMKAGMWVRNGITLRHQAHTYRSVGYRDTGYQRDLLMLQAGLVLCGAEHERVGERFLAQMLDRFEMLPWFRGDYAVRPGYEEGQQLDVLEDFFHLLVIVLSERSGLVGASGGDGGKERYAKVLRHDIAHVLCFKPLSHSDLKARLTDKTADSEEFAEVLREMTTYRAPEGLSDTGSFELKPDFFGLVDPFYAHYSRNHREEAEAIVKKYVAGKTGKKVEEVVLEPRLEPIEEGLFAHLPAFTRTPLFAQVVCAALGYAVGAKVFAPTMQSTRIETFLHMVLHLVLLAVSEDRKIRGQGFVRLATQEAFVMAGDGGRRETVVELLVRVAGMEEYAGTHAMVRHILRKMHLQMPERINVGVLGAALLDRTETGSPASMSAEEKEKKKQEALARQARVMAKMKEQQNSFLQNAGLSAFGDDYDDLDDMSMVDEPANLEEERKTWAFPSGTCILCQEDTDDQMLYGTFAYLGESNILRATPTEDDDFIQEVIDTPANLDRSAEHLRPFGVAGKNKITIEKINPVTGEKSTVVRQTLSKGFPHQPHSIKGPVSTSCGHIMHFRCFETYMAATQRRHNQQIARNQPEDVKKNEFICPLCKALGNTFLPIIWRGKECAGDFEVHAAVALEEWLARSEATREGDLGFLHGGDQVAVGRRQQMDQEGNHERASRYIHAHFTPSLVSSLQELSVHDSPGAASASAAGSSSGRRYSLRRGYSLSSLFRIGREQATQSSDVYHANMQPHHETGRMAELVKAYGRIEDTVAVNALNAPAAHAADGKINTVGALSRALGLSISAFEIAHRGEGSDPAATSLLADLTEQGVTHLRILSETVESYFAVDTLKHHGSGGAGARSWGTTRKGDILRAQLFGNESEVAMIKLRDIGEPLLFQDDTFLFFADWLSFINPSAVGEALNVLQVCLWAEVVKTVFVYRRIVKRMDARQFDAVEVGDAFRSAVIGIATELDRFGAPPHDAEIRALRRLVDTYAQTFLRKALVLLHVRYGLSFDCPRNLDVDAPELQRLTALLHTPSLSDLAAIYTSSGPGPARLRTATHRWLAQARTVTEHPQPPPISLPHPGIFELIGLPSTYDTLTTLALKSKCPSTGKDITDPALCLFCGDIFCSQAVCCTRDKNKGGCYQHMAKCGGKVGVFINIRKCMVLFTHGPGNGCWAHAPYLDKHGEPDPTLRRHQQLFLVGRRYERLVREVWLKGGVGTVISRKLEGDVNPGGWETL